MQTPPLTARQISEALVLLARVHANRNITHAYFPRTIQAYKYGFSVYLADAVDGARPAYIESEIIDYLGDFPYCFTLLECWLADNPAQVQRAGLFMCALGDYISGEPPVIAYGPLRTAVPKAIRICLDDMWRYVNGP